MPKKKADDPSFMYELEPASIKEAIEERSMPKMNPLQIQKEERLQKKEERLASKALPPPTTSFADDRPPEPEVDKGALVDMIHAYREKFPHLKKRNTISITRSEEELLDEIRYIEKQLATAKSSPDLAGFALVAGMTAVETLTREVWNPLHLDLTGLGTITKNNITEFQPILDELTIKYLGNMYLGPEGRLAMAVGAMVMTVPSANSGDPRVKEALDKMQAAAVAPKGSADL